MTIDLRPSWMDEDLDTWRDTVPDRLARHPQPRHRGAEAQVPVRVLDKMGLKGQGTSELFFDGMRVPAENLHGGAEGQGFFQLMSDLPYERTVIGVLSAACMEGACQAALDYAREMQNIRCWPKSRRSRRRRGYSSTTAPSGRWPGSSTPPPPR